MHERGNIRLLRFTKNNYKRIKKDKTMRKTILTLVMMLAMTFVATAGPAITVSPASKVPVAHKVDSVASSISNKAGVDLQKVNEKINAALNDTITSGNGTTVELDGRKGELAPEDIKAISAQWGEDAKQIAYATIAGLLALVLLVLFFRFLNRRNKYRVIEKAIENNYPLNELSLNDVKRSAIYVQQPVITSAPKQPGQVTVGTPISGQTPDNPIVMTGVVNWRALMPAIRVLGWGLFLLLFGMFVAGGNNPFTFIGLALMFVGVCKGFILYKEQQALQEAASRAQQMQSSEPMREGIPVPPPLDDDYKEDDNNTYQPY